jgi:protein-disulfide isomerase
MEKYKTDFASEATNNIINADIKEGQKIGANSTPTFVLNGQKIENPRGYEPFVTLIDGEIAKKKTSVLNPKTGEPQTSSTATP